MNLERMKADAQQVVDGMRTPRQQQARDVLSLVAEVEALRDAAGRRDAAIEELRQAVDRKGAPWDFGSELFNGAGKRK